MPKPRLVGVLFERKTAGLIIAAAGECYEKKDCYRTPQSGGHRFAGAMGASSDLIISDRLFKYFPFCIECKSRKTWTIEDMHSRLPDVSRDVASFLIQASASAIQDKYKRAPLLVITTGTKFPVYCALPFSVLKAYSKRLSQEQEDTPDTFMFTFYGVKWKTMPFSELLKVLSRRVRKEQEVQIPWQVPSAITVAVKNAADGKKTKQAEKRAVKKAARQLAKAQKVALK